MPVKISPQTVTEIFFEKLTELSGQNVHLCYQCGTCSASCPMSDFMEFSPRKVMHHAQFGLDNLLEGINTYWFCASCYACSVRCPRSIDIAKVMETLRQLTLRKSKNYIEPSQMSSEVLKDSPQIALVAGFRKLTS